MWKCKFRNICQLCNVQKCFGCIKEFQRRSSQVSFLTDQLFWWHHTSQGMTQKANLTWNLYPLPFETDGKILSNRLKGGEHHFRSRWTEWSWKASTADRAWVSLSPMSSPQHWEGMKNNLEFQAGTRVKTTLAVSPWCGWTTRGRRWSTRDSIQVSCTSSSVHIPHYQLLPPSIIVLITRRIVQREHVPQPPLGSPTILTSSLLPLAQRRPQAIFRGTLLIFIGWDKEVGGGDIETHTHKYFWCWLAQLRLEVFFFS